MPTRDLYSLLDKRAHHDVWASRFDLPSASSWPRGDRGEWSTDRAHQPSPTPQLESNALLSKSPTPLRHRRLEHGRELACADTPYERQRPVGEHPHDVAMASDLRCDPVNLDR